MTAGQDTGEPAVDTPGLHGALEAHVDELVAQLRYSDDLFRVLFEQSPDGVVLLDPHDPAVASRIITSNDSYARMNGYSVDELAGRSVNVLLTEYSDDPAASLEYLEYVRGQGTVTEWCWHRRKDGSLFPVEYSTSIVRVGGRELVLGVDRDITERKQAEEILKHHALHDELTGLPHRGLLHDRLEQALLAAQRQDAPMSLLFLDLDRFKQVNDTHGHTCGDALLRQVASRLESVVRASDTVARMGGDEFAVVLPTAGAETAAAVARKIIAALREPFPLGEGTAEIGVSIGIAVYPQHAIETEALLQRADESMYAAKRTRSGYLLSG